MATSFRRLFTDRAAGWTITAGGMVVVLSILGIVLFILAEVLPLFRGARVIEGENIAISAGNPEAVVTDEHLTHAVTLDDQGVLQAVRLADGVTVSARRIQDETDASPLSVLPVPGEPWLAGGTRDGRVLTTPVLFDVTFEGDQRVVTPEIGSTVSFAMDPDAGPIEIFSVRVDSENGAGAAAAVLRNGRIAIVALEVDDNPFTGERTESWSRAEILPPVPVTTLLMDRDRRNLYAGAGDSILWWTLDGAEVGSPRRVPGTSPVTTLSFLFGDRTLVVGRESGTIGLWFPVREEGGFRLTRIRGFETDAAVRAVAPSRRDKGFLTLDAAGNVGLYYSTSHRTLWRGSAPLPTATALVYAPKANGAIFVGPRALGSIAIDNPHPEMGWRALFGKVWYEWYDRPEYVWQSTGGTDEFESKLSLVPLVVGTLKGTVYSLILAIPLGVFGAMYASQFMHPSLKRIVKPTVEIMAAMPSVVLGFLAGLWLAPRLEQLFPALLMMLALVPLVILAAGLLWRSLPRRLRGRVPAGGETLLYAIVIVVAGWTCLKLNASFEGLIFGGDFSTWLLETTGLRYDQRNAVVVGIAMGFAVIPIIFSISEDAFSNVPRNLVSGSLALGANRWQTVIRVVLPTASPGIFTAIMVGFGRAIGETMIVLMATGNTPIMDLNPFNGFRTLSANIAVEIPEAPFGGTLYRTLFLATLMLFLLTFTLNTAAEFVRQRLRDRYGRL